MPSGHMSAIAQAKLELLENFVAPSITEWLRQGLPHCTNDPKATTAQEEIALRRWLDTLDPASLTKWRQNPKNNNEIANWVCGCYGLRIGYFFLHAQGVIAGKNDTLRQWVNFMAQRLDTGIYEIKNLPENKF